MRRKNSTDEHVERYRIMPERYNEQSGNAGNPAQAKRGPILGQSHGLSDIDGQIVQQLIREEQHSSRELFIPEEDLAQEATTRMSEEVERVVAESKEFPRRMLFLTDQLLNDLPIDIRKPMT